MSLRLRAFDPAVIFSSRHCLRFKFYATIIDKMLQKSPSYVLKYLNPRAPILETMKNKGKLFKKHYFDRYYKFQRRKSVLRTEISSYTIEQISEGPKLTDKSRIIAKNGVSKKALFCGGGGGGFTKKLKVFGSED